MQTNGADRELPENAEELPENTEELPQQAPHLEDDSLVVDGESGAAVNPESADDPTVQTEKRLRSKSKRQPKQKKINKYKKNNKQAAETGLQNLFVDYNANSESENSPQNFVATRKRNIGKRSSQCHDIYGLLRPKKAKTSTQTPTSVAEGFRGSGILHEPQHAAPHHEAGVSVETQTIGGDVGEEFTEVPQEPQQGEEVCVI